MQGRKGGGEEGRRGGARTGRGRTEAPSSAQCSSAFAKGILSARLSVRC